MVEYPPFSSQSSQYGHNRTSLDQENLGSSPLRNRSTNLSSQKPRGLPSVTPKRFTKFFTPRTKASARCNRQSKAGRQLRDITRNGINRRLAGNDPTESFALRVEKDLSTRPAKRQKLSIDISSSPPQSSPLKHVKFAKDDRVQQSAPLASPTFSTADSLPDLFNEGDIYPTPVQRLHKQGSSRRLLERSFGGYASTSRGFRGPDHCIDSRVETAGFATIPRDSHHFTGNALPFCTTTCNTNSLIAVGDEEGHIRLVDSSPKADFSTIHVDFKVHNNAVIDLAFSPDDYLLATASGDQTSRLVDMHTQQTVCILSGHQSSVKQVRFRPSQENVITTSSRDGTVQVWDLRCSSKTGVQTLRTSFQSQTDADGHVEPATRYSMSRLDVGYGHRAITRPNSEDVRNDTSITAFQHLPNGREHLILTASEVNASIKLWDLRNAGRRNPVPLSSTPIPESHRRTRNYGINAMVLSGDGARVYAVCRDASVYAYSANQLALGFVPEMSSAPSRRRMLREPKQGIAPLYAFKHPSLRIGSFYIRASLRVAKDDRSEMLAVGSSEHSPILFPTDERHLRRREKEHVVDEEEELPSLDSSLRQTSTSSPILGPPVQEHGTALVRAHTKEVTSLAWSVDGDLVTVSDDFTARCWRNDPTRARMLRQCGEAGGERWNSGWADVEAKWDEEDW